jgi:D-alanyl-D-alanine carboxypeptidase (penicillin-binding protein 5/6)
MNADTGAILFAKDPHRSCYPASVTKIATALFVLDEMSQRPLTETTIASAEALKMRSGGKKEPHWLEPDGTVMGLLRGEVVTLNDLLHGLMLVSGNDAANVLAEHLKGDVPAFMEAMNTYLKGLGCQETRFVNPHGLHHPEHITSAFDLALMMRRALKLSAFREIVSTKSYQKPKTNKQPPKELKMNHPLFKKGKYHYPKVIGAKTGYTSQARHNLVAAAEHEGRTLIAVLLGCEQKGDRYEDAIRLFEEAFSEEKVEREYFPSTQQFERILPGGLSPLRAHLASPLTLRYFPAEEPACRALLHWDKINAPVARGAHVGQVQLVSEEGNILATRALIASDAVEASIWFRCKEFVNRIRLSLFGGQS